MKEFDLIKKLTTNLSSSDRTIVGPGDDCAVLDLGLPEDYLLFKTDAIIEHVHFNPDTPPEKVGRKAMARCLSDFAAMAGKPSAALVTLGLPKDFSEERIEKVYEGLREIAKQFETDIAGGETTTCAAGLMLSISMIGTVGKTKFVRRDGSQVGDAIFVTGDLGGSLAGKHLDFIPRISEARWLVEHFYVHAMIDLSDGLAGDLKHFLTDNAPGAELLKTSIPVSRDAKLRSRNGESEKPPVVAALTDGEDYELLFTVSPKDAVAVLDGWKLEFPETPLTCIGKIVKTAGIHLRDREFIQRVNWNGYEHFS